jgi:hypothetical protein
MPGREASFDYNIAKHNAFAIGEKASSKLRPSCCTKTNVGTRCFGKFKMARQKVGMKMCFENMGDCEIQLACTIKVLVNVTLGVYDDCIACGLVGY